MRSDPKTAASGAVHGHLERDLSLALPQTSLRNARGLSRWGPTRDTTIMSRVLYSWPWKHWAASQDPRNYADFECLAITVIMLVFIQVWAKCGQTRLHPMSQIHATVLQYYRNALLSNE